MKILISGSSSGIGRAITEKMLEDNNFVIGIARDHTKFSPPTKNYQSFSIDFSKIATLEKELLPILKEHSDIDGIISCAGYGEFSELEQFSVANMQNMMNVNFMSQAILIKTFLPQMKKNKSGKIIVIGSECALEGQKKGSIYCASKFALRGFTQSVRKECASANISVTLINPGFVQTPFFDKLAFRPGADVSNYIDANEISCLVALIINDNITSVLEEINLQPMKKVFVKAMEVNENGK